MDRVATIRRAALACLLMVTAVRADLTVPSTAPAYTAAGVVHAATQTAAALAPNTIATIYGVNLAFTTNAVTSGDPLGGQLPTSLDGVRVLVYGIPCGLFFVSPGQINFLIPYELTVENAPLQVTRQGVAGPAVTITLAVTAPAFFEWKQHQPIAVHADGTLISTDSPARAAEVIVLFAAGLGRTLPDQVSGRIPAAAATILRASQLQILLNGVALPASSVQYAGVTPGFAGLYQINLKLPEVLAEDPEIRVSIGAQLSPSSILLPAH